MTSRTDAAQHPDASEISDLSILAPSRAASVRKHLGGCSSCAEIKDSLDEIQKLLGRLPDPVEMPSDIADRIDAALAAEALRDVDGGEKTTHVSRETSRASLAAESASTSRPSGHPVPAQGPAAPAQCGADGTSPHSAQPSAPLSSASVCSSCSRHLPRPMATPGPLRTHRNVERRPSSLSLRSAGRCTLSWPQIHRRRQWLLRTRRKRPPFIWTPARRPSRKALQWWCLPVWRVASAVMKARSPRRRGPTKA